jgi:anti-sigma factor RsiW
MDATQMTCAQLVEQLSDYLEDALRPDQMARVRVHLHNCGGCETHLGELRVTLRTLSSLPMENLPSEVEQNVLDIYRKWVARPDS